MLNQVLIFVPKGNHEYDIILYTGDQSDSTSNADIHVKLKGTLGESENIVLEAKKYVNSLQTTFTRLRTFVL